MSGEPLRIAIHPGTTGAAAHAVARRLHVETPSIVVSIGDSAKGGAPPAEVRAAAYESGGILRFACEPPPGFVPTEYAEFLARHSINVNGLHTGECNIDAEAGVEDHDVLVVAAQFGAVGIVSIS